MDQRHKIWAIRAGIGTGVCALLTAWMVPNTTPIGKPSVIVGMSGTAEAQKPTYSAIPDSAIPSWAATLQPAPGAPSPMRQAPVQVADLGPTPAMPPQDVAQDDATTSDPAPVSDDAPAAVAEAPAPPPSATPPPPAPQSDYRAQRAAWAARLDSVMQGQRGPG